mmetsp:Transcript_39968/g.78671  ORF Transcript_39968/g.78671 Transcript_39968/m.78671 type:complete len:314 (+) Transcript_39968:29-970(+)
MKMTAKLCKAVCLAWCLRSWYVQATQEPLDFFSEELLLRTVADRHLEVTWNFTLDFWPTEAHLCINWDEFDSSSQRSSNRGGGNGNGELCHFGLFPRSVADLLHVSGAERFAVSLVGGVWRPEWGPSSLSAHALHRTSTSTTTAAAAATTSTTAGVNVASPPFRNVSSSLLSSRNASSTFSPTSHEEIDSKGELKSGQLIDGKYDGEFGRRYRHHRVTGPTGASLDADFVVSKKTKTKPSPLRPKSGENAGSHVDDVGDDDDDDDEALATPTAVAPAPPALRSARWRSAPKCNPGRRERQGHATLMPPSCPCY